MATRTLSVKLGFAGALDAPTLRVETPADGSETIYDLKSKIARAAAGEAGTLRPEDLLLSFGPTDRKVGAQYVADPTVDERALKLERFSILAWIERFPHWALTVRLLPPTPPPPGVAIQEAAAAAEQRNPAEAVQDARARGDIPKLSELPAPWGPLAAPKASDASLVAAGYLPPVYPAQSSPLVDAA